MERQQAAEQRRKQEWWTERVAQLKGNSGVPLELAHANLDDLSFIEKNIPHILPQYRAARDRIARLINEPGELFLRGNAGPGKSHLAAALIFRFCDLGRPARHVSAAEFFRDLKSTFGKQGHTERDMVNRYHQYPLLVIDEYEVRSDSDWFEYTLRDLINKRHGDLRCTVFITNLKYDELVDRLPAPVRSRIDQRGGVIDFDWEDLRPFTDPCRPGRPTA